MNFNKFKLELHISKRYKIYICNQTYNLLITNKLTCKFIRRY